MRQVETSARTVEEAIAQALEILNTGRERVEVDILSEGSRSVFGIGGEEARVRVTLIEAESAGEEDATQPPEDVVDIARETIEGILQRMGLRAKATRRAEALVQEAEGTPLPILFDIEGEDLGILIGRRGETLACLQYIVRLIVSQRIKRLAPTIVIDVNGYKQHRYQSLRELAGRMAEQVAATGNPFTLEPMPAYERRIVHLALAEHPEVSTQSYGLGDDRKVVILPKDE
jgi:spoIIIJ-associated protein